MRPIWVKSWQGVANISYLVLVFMNETNKCILVQHCMTYNVRYHVCVEVVTWLNVIFVQSIGFWLQLFCLPVKPWECFMDFTHSSIVIHSCTRMHFWDKGQRAEEYIQSNKLSPVHSLGHTSVRDLPLSSPQLSVTLHVFCCFIHLKHAHVYFYCSGRDH